MSRTLYASLIHVHVKKHETVVVIMIIELTLLFMEYLTGNRVNYVVHGIPYSDL